MSDRKRLVTTEESEELEKNLACIKTSLESMIQTSLKWKEEERRWREEHKLEVIADKIIFGLVLALAVIYVWDMVIHM